MKKFDVMHALELLQNDSDHDISDQDSSENDVDLHDNNELIVNNNSTQNRRNEITVYIEDENTIDNNDTVDTKYINRRVTLVAS